MVDLITPQNLRSASFANRVFDLEQADVVFVPFFATLSTELQLGMAKGAFRKKVATADVGEGGGGLGSRRHRCWCLGGGFSMGGC
jgi:hypothetical protein